LFVEKGTRKEIMLPFFSAFLSMRYSLMTIHPTGFCDAMKEKKMRRERRKKGRISLNPLMATLSIAYERDGKPEMKD
jgi:hypothetical protein